MAISHDHAHNRVQFQLLMDLSMQYGGSLTLTRWIAEALVAKEQCLCNLETGALLLVSSQCAAYHRITALASPLQ